MTDEEFDARYVALKALVEYANPLNWDVDENGIRRVWKEPGSETPEAYNGFELAKAALSTAAQPTEEPVAYLWQHSETGRTRVVMPDGVITADATWHVVGPLVLAAAPKAAPARKRFFSYDDQGEFELHATLELAEAAANAAFEYCADEARDEGWSECVEQICYGEIVGAVFETKREPWNEETLGSPPEPNVEHVEYALKSSPPYTAPAPAAQGDA